MLKAAIYLGRPYIYYVPKKLAMCSLVFDDLNRIGDVGVSCDTGDDLVNPCQNILRRGIYLDRLSDPMVLATEPGYVASAEALAGISKLSQKRRWRISDVLEINRCVMGAATSPRLRSGAMWIGATHPGDACYVAPPAADVAALMADLVEFCSSSRWPPLLKGVIAMQQLLLVHPFEDGNGRTARALMFCIAGTGPASIALVLDVIEELWRFKQLRLLAVQQHIRNNNDWSPLVDVLRECVSMRANRV